MTTQASKDTRSGENRSLPPSRDDTANYNDEERALAAGVSRAARSLRGNIGQDSGTSSPETAGETAELQTRATTTSADGSFVRRKTSQLFEAIRSVAPGKTSSRTSPALTPRLASLVEAYVASDIAKAVQADIEEAKRKGQTHEQLDTDEAEGNHRNRRRGASWPTQFRILSGRAFKNLYRDPALLTAHYLSSIALACE